MSTMDILPPDVERERGEWMMTTVIRLQDKYGTIDAIPEDDPEFKAVFEYNQKVHRRGKLGNGKREPVKRAPNYRAKAPDRPAEVEQEAQAYMHGESIGKISEQHGYSPDEVRADLRWARAEGILPRGQRIKLIEARDGDDVFNGTKADAAKHFHVQADYFSGHAGRISWDYNGQCLFTGADDS